MFKKKRHALLGIDISSTSVKIVELAGADKNYVTAYGRELLPMNVLDGNSIKDPQGVAGAIKRLLKRGQFNTNEAVVAVPDSAVISKVIQINEGLNDAEMEELVLLEADKYIPYPIHEVNIDFEVLGPSKQGINMLDVLVVASRTENVNNRVEAITLAGLDVKVVDVESFAVERAVQYLCSELPAHGQDKVIAVVDIGESVSHLFVLHGMKMIFTREEEFGGRVLLDAAAINYKLDAREAFLMFQSKQFPQDFEDVILNPFIDNLILHIKRSIQFFFSTSQHMYIDHLLLAGGIARINNLDKIIHQQTGIPCSVANIFPYLKLSSKIKAYDINDHAPAFLIACGLALRV